MTEGIETVELSTRNYLAEYFSDMADWYDSSTHQNNGHAPDGRPVQAGFYLEFAQHLGQLPEDDLRLIALAKLTGFDDQTGFSPGPRVSAAIADAGQFVEGPPEPFLEYLVHAALDDHLDSHHHVSSILIDGVEVHGG